MRAHGERLRGASRAGPRKHRTYSLYQFAQNPPWFKAALKRVHLSGGRIRLPAGRVAPLQLFDLTPSAPIRLVGRPSTMLSGISIKRSERRGRQRPPHDAGRGDPAIADVSASSRITFRDVRFLGTQEDTGVALQLDPDDRDITVAQAEFAHCQHGLACILAQGRGLVVDHVRFHDVRDADVIRGAADDVTISDSDLHDALAGTHSDNHNDLIQILGGGPWTIVRSHFGVRSNGAAQVYVDPRSGPAGPRARRARRVEPLHGLEPGHVLRRSTCASPAQSSVPLATGVEFVNNTIVSANIAAIVLADEYANVPSSQRPLVAEQHPRAARSTRSAASRARVTNVIGSGASCPGIGAARPAWTARGAPTAARPRCSRAAPPTGRRRRT